MNKPHIKKAALIGTSFVGDSLLNLALCRAIHETYQCQVMFPVLPRMFDIIYDHMIRAGEPGDRFIIWGNQPILDTVCNPVPAVTERFENGGIFSSYTDADVKMRKEDEKEIYEFAYMLKVQGVDTIFIAHWFYGMVLLANYCSLLGIRVIGYKAHFSQIGLTDYRGQVTLLNCLAHEGFIGDYLCKAFTGRRLSRSDFYLEHHTPVDEGYALLMPSSRQGFQTAGNWDLDIHLLRHYKIPVKVVIWEGDLNKGLYESLVKAWASNLKPDITIVKDFGDTIQYIANAKFVITNDSGQFHASWLIGKPIIVKTKDYIHDSWVPEEELIEDQIIAIPPYRMFPSSYVVMMGNILKEGGWIQ